MSRRTTGFGFVGLAVFLYATRFVAAAIYGSSMTGWGGDNFRSLLKYVDQGFTLPIALALVVGISYLVWGELAENSKLRS